MKRWIALFGLAAVLCHGERAQAEPTKQLRAQIEVMLTAPEYAPSKAEWLDLGADAAIVLREVALDRSQLAVKRGRAATALGHFTSQSTQQTLTQLVGESSENWLLRGKAARSLARAFGEQSLVTVRTLLGSSNSRLREAAIKAISLVVAPESRNILRAHLDAETSKHLRVKVTRLVLELDVKLEAERAPSRPEAE